MSKLPVVRSKPTLVVENNQTFISTRRWSDQALLEFFEKAPFNKWYSIGDIARTAYGQNIATTRDRVRRNLPKLWSYALFQHGIFLVVEAEPPHNRAKAVKALDTASKVERQLAVEKLLRLLRRKELSQEKYAVAMKVVDPDDKTDLI